MQQLENRTSDTERDIEILSSEIDVLNDRVGILEQTGFGEKPESISLVCIPLATES